MAMNGDKPQPSIVCRNVIKTYGSGNAEVHALRGVDLDVYPGEITMLVGPSGCGKTTLLSVVAGILRPTSGSVVALGTELTKLNSWRRTAFRRQNVGFVFQQFNLLPALTAAENASVPLVIQGHSKRSAMAHANELLTKMDMGKRLNNLPGNLSGGQQQRVAIARALVHQPHLLVCDEPTSALDAKTGHTILELLREIAIEGDRAVVIVTHDSRIFEFADTLARMDDGQIVSIERQAKGGRALTA
jgi:putative ABC transport system ATP-binding protein